MSKNLSFYYLTGILGGNMSFSLSIIIDDTFIKIFCHGNIGKHFAPFG